MNGASALQSLLLFGFTLIHGSGGGGARMQILGTIPSVPPGRPTVAEQAHLVESFVEARRAIRTHVPPGEVIAFALSSPGAGVGRTFVASNLARSFAAAGFRALLVDAGGVAPGLATGFGVPAGPGLSDYFCGEAVATIVHDTDYPRLSVVPPGLSSAPRRSDDATGMRGTLQDLRERFDVIVVDLPPGGFAAVPREVRSLVDCEVCVTQDSGADVQTDENLLAQSSGDAPRRIGVIVNRAGGK